jgi:hypothetical protein
MCGREVDSHYFGDNGESYLEVFKDCWRVGFSRIKFASWLESTDCR